MNPVAAGWVTNWKVEFYDHLTDDTRTIDTTAKTLAQDSIETGNYWVGNLHAPNLFRIFRNMKKFEDRR